MNDRDLAAHLRESADAVVLVESDGKIILANRAAQVLFDYLDSDLAGQQIELLVPDDGKANHQTLLREYARSPRQHMLGQRSAPLMGRRRNGSLFPAEISLSPSGAEASLTVMCVVRDITERTSHDLESAMVRESLDAVEEAVLIFDAETLAFTYVNNGACSQTGYSRQELLDGMTPLSIKPEFDSISFADLIDPLKAGDRSVITFETRHRRKDGSSVAVEVLLQKLGPLNDEHPSQLMAMVRDITARKKQQDRLVRSEQAFRSAFEHAPVGMAITDLSSPAERIIVSANEALGTMLGCSPQELEGRTFDSISHPDDKLNDISAATVLGDGRTQVYRAEKRYLHADGHYVWALLSAVRLDSFEGPRALAHIVDISRRVEVEAASREQRIQLELAQDRERIARELQDRVIQRLFAIGMSLQGALTAPDRLTGATETAIDELDKCIAVVRDSIFRLGSDPASPFPNPEEGQA